MFMTPKIQACHYVSASRTVSIHSQTFENKSSAPPNPPAGFVALVTPPPPTPPPPETGAALSQPPKSSSPDIVGAGFEGAPQPAPTSFAVRVSGTFIMEAGDAVAAAPAGSGSGVLHAFPPPHGSMVEERMLAVTVGVDTLDGSGLGSGLGAGGGDGFRLNADFISSWGDAMDMVGGGGGGAAVVVVGGDDRSKRSSEADRTGGCGLLCCCCGLCGGGCGGGDAKPVKPMSCPREENESLRD